MQKSLILSESEKEARNELVQKNREKRAQLENRQKSISVCMICFAEEISH